MYVLYTLFCIGKSTPEPKKVASRSPGITKFLASPKPPPGEDDVSFQRHIKVL